MKTTVKTYIYNSINLRNTNYVLIFDIYLIFFQYPKRKFNLSTKTRDALSYLKQLMNDKILDITKIDKVQIIVIILDITKIDKVQIIVIIVRGNPWGPVVIFW